MAAITATATNTRSSRKPVCDRTMNRPRPLEAPTHSAMTAPSTAYVALIWSPAKNAGTALGMSTLRRTRSRFAPNDRARSTRSRSACSSPSVVETTIGKKQISATTSTFGITPNPNQTTISGAITIIGTF